MSYFFQNFNPSTNISLKNLYRSKGVNLDYDKTDNFSLASRDFTYGPQFGPGYNPWISAYYGYPGNSNRGGMVEFTDSDGATTMPDSRMSHFREVNWKYCPYVWGSNASGGPIADYRGGNMTQSSTWDTSGQAPGWNAIVQMKIYNINRDAPNLVSAGIHFISATRRSSATLGNRIAVGRVDMNTSGIPTTFSNISTTDITNTSMSCIGLNNVGMGTGTAYATGTAFLGSSTQATITTRNTSNTAQYRVATLDTSAPGGTNAPSISLSGASTYSNQGGSMVLNHVPNGINMGKGVQWTFGHRGANWGRIYYTNLSGTTVSYQGAVQIFSQTSTTTLQTIGSMVKITDECAILIAPHRNGASSGNSRRIVAHTLVRGANGVPSIETAFLASYDWAATDTQTVTSCAGSNDDKASIKGLSVYARSGPSRVYFIGWTYNAATDSFTWESEIDDSQAYQTNSYRAKHSVLFLGFNYETSCNYYHVVVAGDAGDYHLVIQQNVTNDALTITHNIGKINTSYRRSNYIIAGPENQLPWFLDNSGGGMAADYSGVGCTIVGTVFDTANDVRATGLYYNMAGI
tara:strand:+ start:691 stop:2415 length:1725 start_codon:yes stop_codon:yes gene_type:complete